MSTKLLIANWKMNGSISLLNEFAEVMTNPNLILALPYIFIPTAVSLCHSANIAAQNCSEFKSSGAYTGEISSEMLKASGANYVIIAHSERRNLMAETSSSINAKIKNSLDSGLHVIYCVSENFEEQIQNDLIGIQDKSNIMIAFEPLSAIGTGITPSSQDADKIAKKIHEISGAKVLYGGSVSSKNIVNFCSLESICGVLVGGASLKVEEVKSMLAQIQEPI